MTCRGRLPYRGANAKTRSFSLITEVVRCEPLCTLTGYAWLGVVLRKINCFDLGVVGEGFFAIYTCTWAS